MKEKLKEALHMRHAHIKPLLLDRYASKYIAAMMSEIATQYVMMSKDDVSSGEMNFAANKVSEASGRYKVDGVGTGYVYQLMQQHPSTSLVISMYTGNSLTHRVSRVILNPAYKKDILRELASLTVECKPDHLQDLQAKANKRVNIDLESLTSYMAQTKLALQAPLSDAYEEKLIRNLQIAHQLVGLAKHDAATPYLDEYWDDIDSGRSHGHGLSLQRIPKEVGHAALGRCYRYDFKAASYALMTSLATQIDPNLKTATLREYVRYRSAIRKRIAKDVGISEEWMKSIFTSLGFGAALKDNPHNAIRAKLGQEKYHKLMCNWEFIAISNQLKQVSDVILNEVGKGDFEWLGRTYTEVNPKDGTKRSKNQKLAWLYQCMESDALATFIKMIPKGYKVKLLVHDCVYLDKRLSSQHMASIKSTLQQRYDLLNFDGDEIVPIHTSDFLGKREREIDQLERQHRACIAEQERLAELFYIDHLDYSLASIGG